MNAVLISIQPKWCGLIASEKKTIEVRKTKPKLDAPFKCYIYCTKPHTKNPNEILEIHSGGKIHKANGKVIGEFVCDLIANYEAELWDDKTFERIRELYEHDDFTETGEYEYKTIADNGDDFWQENMLCKASCLTVTEMRNYLGKGFSEFYGWHISNLVIYNEPKKLSELRGLRKTKFGYEPLRITCPPQSWCYVEEVI